MAAGAKSTRKGTGKAAGGRSAPRRKAEKTSSKDKPESRKPVGNGAKTKPAAQKAGRPPPPRNGASDARAAALGQQRRIGSALIILGAAGIAGIGIWVGSGSLGDAGHWAVRAVARGMGVALIAVFMWTVLNRRRTVSGLLVFGTGAASLLVYEAGSAWLVDRARDAANRTLLQLESGARDVGSLTPVEIANPYIEAYVVMRDIHWELDARSDDQMSRYRSYYENYTARGAFLDVNRLATAAGIRRSISEIDDLQRRLLRVEASRPDIADLLLTVDLLEVDAGTRAMYAQDLRAARRSFIAAIEASVARERETLGATRSALETLLEVDGRYRIEDGRIVFDRPDDAARFAGIMETD